MWPNLNARYEAYRDTTIREYRGALRLLRPTALDRAGKQRLATLKAHSEALRRLPTEHDRIAKELRQEEEALWRTAAAGARHRARPIRDFVEDSRAQIARARRDVGQSFPDALLGLTKDGLVALAHLKVTMLPMLASASTAALLATYQRALSRKDDPAALIECEIIEDLVASGAGLAADEGDLHVVRGLRELVASAQDLRLPADLPDLDDLAHQLDTLDARADLLKLDPINLDANPEAAAAFEQHREALAAAGQPSDEDSQAPEFEAATILPPRPVGARP